MCCNVLIKTRRYITIINDLREIYDTDRKFFCRYVELMLFYVITLCQHREWFLPNPAMLKKLKKKKNEIVNIVNEESENWISIFNAKSR